MRRNRVEADSALTRWRRLVRASSGNRPHAAAVLRMIRQGGRSTLGARVR